MNVTILDGIKIGDGAVIGAGAVVTKDIPPYAVAVGCPIKIIKYRFSKEIIDSLIASKWWDQDDVVLKEIEKNLFDVEKFLANIKQHND
jgi:serine acetyltransferase